MNEGTGGVGLYHGGDGVIREMIFRRPLTLCILCERRVYEPYGLKGLKISNKLSINYLFILGGGPGKRGKNTLIRQSGEVIQLGGKESVEVFPGVRFSYDGTMIYIMLLLGCISSGESRRWRLWE